MFRLFPDSNADRAGIAAMLHRHCFSVGLISHIAPIAEGGVAGYLAEQSGTSLLGIRLPLPIHTSLKLQAPASIPCT